MAITRSMKRKAEKLDDTYRNNGGDEIVQKNSTRSRKSKAKKFADNNRNNDCDEIEQKNSLPAVSQIEVYTKSSNLCEDLISEIFRNLPPKLLLQLRSLSRSWCSRIASSYFIRMYASKNPKQWIIRHRIVGENNDLEDIYTLLTDDRVPLCPMSGSMDITAVKVPGVGNPTLVGSLNGILCLFDPKVGMNLWNYSIRHKFTLPDYPCSKDSTKKVAFGFGFDPKSDDYKIVGLSYSKYTRDAASSYLYSMKTNSWSKIASPSPTYLRVKSRGRCFNGSLHWVVKCKPPESTNGYYMMMTFDLSSHVFGTILLPEASYGSKRIEIFNGSLAVVSRRDDNSDTNIQASLRREENNKYVASWSKIENLVYRRVCVCSCDVDWERYDESLQLLDRGTPCGETIMEEE